MKRFISIILVCFMVGCTEQINEVAEQTVEDRVNNAEIISGEFPFSQDKATSMTEVPSGSFLYIPIPTKNGYLKFETKSKQEKAEILSLVQKRFEKEFEAAYNNGHSNARTTCDEWQMINPDDPNSGVFRGCNFGGPIVGYYWIETCDCGYCCD